jgi:hypothetical protein
LGSSQLNKIKTKAGQGYFYNNLDFFDMAQVKIWKKARKFQALRKISFLSFKLRYFLTVSMSLIIELKSINHAHS